MMGLQLNILSMKASYTHILYIYLILFLHYFEWSRQNRGRKADICMIMPELVI